METTLVEEDDQIEADATEDPPPQDHSNAHKLPSEREVFIRHLTLGIDDILQAHPMVKDIKLVTRPPVNPFLLTSWERRYRLRLPTDLKAYYNSTNGFSLTWSLVYGDDVLNVGNLSINTIQQLTPMETTLQSKEPEPDQDPYKAKPPPSITIPLSVIQKPPPTWKKSGRRVDITWGPETTAFRLDSSNPNCGTVYVVYNEVESSTTEILAGEPDVQIWFLDRSLQWHFLAPSFTIYYRMAIFHLGLPDWMYRFTPIGFSSWTEQIFWLVAPKLLQPVQQASSIDTTTIWSNDPPPEAQYPNSTTNVLSLSMLKKRKKINKH